MALRIRLQGRPDIERYLGGALAHAPSVRTRRLRHIVGGDEGGAIEWFPAPGSNVPGGITALEIDASSRISRLTTVYDNRQLPDAGRRSLAWGTRERVVRGHEKVLTGGQMRSPLVATKSPRWWPAEVPTPR